MKINLTPHPVTIGEAPAPVEEPTDHAWYGEDACYCGEPWCGLRGGSLIEQSR